MILSMDALDKVGTPIEYPIEVGAETFKIKVGPIDFNARSLDDVQQDAIYRAAPDDEPRMRFLREQARLKLVIGWSDLVDEEGKDIPFNHDLLCQLMAADPDLSYRVQLALNTHFNNRPSLGKKPSVASPVNSEANGESDSQTSPSSSSEPST
jgi:hypothetical protein